MSAVLIARNPDDPERLTADPIQKARAHHAFLAARFLHYQQGGYLAEAHLTACWQRAKWIDVCCSDAMRLNLAVPRQSAETETPALIAMIGVRLQGETNNDLNNARGIARELMRRFAELLNEEEITQCATS